MLVTSIAISEHIHLKLCDFSQGKKFTPKVLFLREKKTVIEIIL